MARQQLDKQLHIRSHPHEAPASTDQASSTTAVLDDKLPPFFTHNGLDASDLRACTHLSNTRFPGSSASEIPNQGFCSHTLIIRPNNEPSCSPLTGNGVTPGLAPPRSKNSRPEEQRYKILQFRPEKYALPFKAIKIARRIHGEWVAIAMPLGVIRPPAFGLRDDLGEEAVGGMPRSCNWDGDVESERQELEDEGRGVCVRIKELWVYEMDLLPGIAYEGILPRHAELSAAEERRLKSLLDGLARFFRQTWSSGSLPGWLMAPAQVQGRVGGTIPWRLWKVANELPAISGLRDEAKMVQEEVKAGGMKDLPKCLSHGDLLPSNLLVDAETGKLTGVVDWAEAEVLPFGMALYGIERLLGWVHQPTTEETDNAADESADRATNTDARADMSSSPINGKADSVISSSSPLPPKPENQTSTTEPSKTKAKFTYYNQAPALRAHFYAQLELLIPDLREPGMKKQVALARKVGVLLWFGFGWDDGKIDRIINEKDDPVEMAQLIAFLGAGGEEW